MRYLTFIVLFLGSAYLYEATNIPRNCLLRADPGPCRGLKKVKRWFFDGKTCKQFVYGGCFGNKNNFKTKIECKNACKQLPDICYMPKEQGPCKGRFVKWYFDGKQCSKFIYGGCDGNRNNFGSRTKCRNACVDTKLPMKCYLPEEEGLCKTKVPSWYFDGEKCSQFIFGGWNGNENRFATEFECKRDCRQLPTACYQPKKTGDCKGNFTKWFFDGQKCTKFVYSGCKGNRNRFDKQSKCEFKCGINKIPTQKDKCKLPQQRGACNKNITSWYFDGNKCEQFLYSGCGGNGNRFKSKYNCRRDCGQLPPVCYLPMKTGSCKYNETRWHFNGKKCVKFLYTGCNGNANNFDNEKKCINTCRIANLKPICYQPKNIGKCKAKFRRWYFDGEKCTAFVFRGCGGNRNNFKTEINCMKNCKL